MQSQIRFNGFMGYAGQLYLDLTWWCCDAPKRFQGSSTWRWYKSALHHSSDLDALVIDPRSSMRSGFMRSCDLWHFVTCHTRTSQAYIDDKVAVKVWWAKWFNNLLLPSLLLRIGILSSCHKEPCCDPVPGGLPPFPIHLCAKNLPASTALRSLDMQSEFCMGVLC